MPAKVLDRGRLFDAFVAEDLRARRAAGNRVGTRIVNEQRRKMRRNYPNASDRFLAGTRRVVSRRDGTLTLLQMAPFATALEDGATVRPRNARFLTIATDLAFAGRRGRLDFAELRRKGETFTVRNRKGTLLLMRRLADASTQRQALATASRRVSGTGKARAFPIAVLATQAKVPALLGYGQTVRARIAEYVREYEERLTRG